MGCGSARAHVHARVGVIARVKLVTGRPDHSDTNCTLQVYVFDSNCTLQVYVCTGFLEAVWE